MDYYPVEESLQVLFERFIPLSSSQRRHLSEISLAVLLAGSSQLSRIAPWLKHPSQQDSRVQWLRRLLSSKYLCQDLVYQPFLHQALQAHHVPRWHLVLDRSPWEKEKTDLVLLSLNFRNRAIPLVWDFIPYGSTNQNFQIAFIERSLSLLQPKVDLLLHGDGEFNSVPFMQYLRYRGIHFILGQSGKKKYRQRPNRDWQSLNTLPLSKNRPVYLENIELTQDYAYGPLNLFAFYQTHHSKKRRKREIGYYVTSLPISPHLRLLGRRRWGIEPCFQDYKSSGWQIQDSQLRDPKRREGLMTILSLNYLWMTCLGRWLCKISQRQLVDAQSQRHLSLFRLGWDWLVHRYITGLSCPTLLSLYQ
jgi:hypothetical protein